jgi:hypothetical protein
MRLQFSRLSVSLLAVGCFVSFTTAFAATPRHAKTKPNPPADAIRVVGHIAISGPITQLLPTQHFSSYYLYAQHRPGQAVTLIDVTKPAAPSVIADLPCPPDGASSNLIAVAGTAALAAEQPGPSAPGRTEIVQIMSFADPAHPTVARQFPDVTAIGDDSQRGLIFLADNEGVWILQKHFAEDPAIERAYDTYLLYNR